MAWSGGNYTKGNNATGGWVGDASLGIGIEAGRHDTQDDDFATGINQCLNKDGSNAATGNLNLGGNKLTNVAVGTVSTDAITLGQAQAGIDTQGIALATTQTRFSNDISGPFVTLRKSRGATVGTNTIVQNSDQLGGIIFSGANGTGYDQAAAIIASSDGVPGASADMPGALRFYTTADGSNILTEKMIIKNDGAIAIGGSPRNAMKLDVKGRLAIGSGNTDAELVWTRPANADQTAWDLAVRTDVGGSNEDLKLMRFVSNVYSGIAMQIVNSNGYVGINTSAPNGFLSVQYDGSADDFAVGRSITGANYFVSKSIYDKTTVAGANVAVESTGGSYPVRRSTSSIKYKKDIVDLDPTFADKLHQFRPVFFKSKCFGDHPEWTHYGFIAEELAEIEPRFVSFGYQPDDYEDYEFVDADGTTQTAQRLKADAQPEPEGVYYDRIVTFLTSVVQRQQKKLEALEARIAALEA